MEKLGLLYQGKAKKMYATDDPEVLWVEYLNQATAGNGAKKEQIKGKAELNNRITTLIFGELKRAGIDSHLIRQLSPTDQLVRKMTMFPLEIVQRNIAAGSFSKRLGVKESTVLSAPVLEYYFKSDPLNDPFINDDDAVALNLATRDELASIAALARRINVALTAMFKSIDVQLVDFKIEMGKTSDGQILLADEITPDTCRLWDLRGGKNDGAVDDGGIERLDKDIFRKDLGSILPAYHEILDRLEKLAASH